MPAVCIKFQGEIVYAKSEVEIRLACNELLDQLEKSGGNKLTLGFDCEWQYMPHDLPPALIQLCLRVPDTPHPQSDLEEGIAKKRTHAAASQQPAIDQEQPAYKCYLLQVACLGPDGRSRAHPTLKQLLENPKVFLATIGDRDEEKLSKDLCIQPANLEQVNMAHFLLQQEQRASAMPAAPGLANIQSLQTQKASQKAALQTKRQRQRLRQQREHHLLEEKQQQDQEEQGVHQPQQMAREVISLASLVGLYLGMRMDKGCQLANDKWELPLDERYMRYAATDAYATLLVFEVIRRKLRPFLATKTR